MALPNSFSGKARTNKTNGGGLVPSSQTVVSLFRAPPGPLSQLENRFDELL